MKQPFVLIIDAETQAADAARFILKRAGFQTCVADSAEDGLKRAFETEPDVILCAVGMSRINGLDILRRLKAHPSTSRIPVILTSESDLLDCAGMFTFLIKPFDAVSLVSAARNAVADADLLPALC